MGATAPPDGLYQVDTVTETTFTITTTKPGSGTGSFTATRQNVGLSTAHVGVSSEGTGLLTFLYGNPDAADAAIVPFDLRLNVTNLQYFVGPAPSPDEARPSIWLQLVQPVTPHIGPAKEPTRIPVVLRQYPTPPTLVGQSGLAFTPTMPSGNPLADAADWKYGLTYQAALAAQDQINANVTYNTKLRSSGGGNQALRTLAVGDAPSFDLFTALGRFTAVYGVIQTILPNLDDPHWGDAVQVFADRVGEVTTNTDWHPRPGFRALPGFSNVTDSYVVTDMMKSPGSDTREITLQWPASQGQSTFAGVTLAVTALDPKSAAFPQAASAYPGQTTTPVTDGLQVEVPNAPITEGIGVAHLVEVDGLNVLGGGERHRVDPARAQPDHAGRAAGGAGVRLQDHVCAAEPAGHAVHRQHDGDRRDEAARSGPGCRPARSRRRACASASTPSCATCWPIPCSRSRSRTRMRRRA